MELDYDLLDELSVLASDLRDLQSTDEHSTHFKTLVTPLVLNRLHELVQLISPSEQIVDDSLGTAELGRPRKISGLLEEWVIEQSKTKSSREIQELLKTIGLEIHFNTILNTIKRNKNV